MMLARLLCRGCRRQKRGDFKLFFSFSGLLLLYVLFIIIYISYTYVSYTCHPLARLQLTCCARRNHPRQVLELVPAGVVAEAEEPEQEDGVSTTSESTNPGPRLQLCVVPNSRCPNAGILGPTARLGAYFGSEGLEPPERLYHNEIRWYAVWHIPGIGRWRVAGIHWGFDNTAYAAILALHRGIFEGIAFRRCDSREEAAEIFKARAEGFDLEESLSNRIFGWSFTYDLESWQPGFPEAR